MADDSLTLDFNNGKGPKYLPVEQRQADGAFDDLKFYPTDCAYSTTGKFIMKMDISGGMQCSLINSDLKNVNWRFKWCGVSGFCSNV